MRKMIYYFQTSLVVRWERICLQCRRPWFDPWVRTILWRREWLPTPLSLPGESHAQKSLAGYSPWGQKEHDRTEQLILSLIEGIREYLKGPQKGTETERKCRLGALRLLESKNGVFRVLWVHFLPTNLKHKSRNYVLGRKK